MQTSFFVAGAVLLPSLASAAVTGYVLNPSNNSGDFASAAAGLSLAVDSTVDFETHPAGPLITSSYYAGSNGVTLSGTSVYAAYGPGASGGTVTSPASTGEGLRTGTFGSIINSGQNWSLTATFASPVAGAGFMTVDYFNPWDDNPMTLEAFDGPDGTGSLIGSYSATPFCFQLNYTYFMGVMSTDGDIRSVRISSAGRYGDGVFVDFLSYTVPGPGAASMLLALTLVGRRRR